MSLDAYLFTSISCNIGIAVWYCYFTLYKETHATECKNDLHPNIIHLQNFQQSYLKQAMAGAFRCRLVSVSLESHRTAHYSFW